jgi:hypothetical protein
MASTAPSSPVNHAQPAQTFSLPPATITPAASPAIPQPNQLAQSRRPLQREGAVYILTSEERALEDAMLRSSPEPSEAVLGKRTRDDDDGEQDSVDNTPEDEAPSTLQSLAPTLSNVTAATLRYATQKRLRAEQRGELEAFLLVSIAS